MMLSQLDNQMEKNEVKHLSQIMYKKEKKPQNRAKTIKLLEKKHRPKSLWLYIRQWFLRYDTKAQATVEKIDKLYFIESTCIENI